jgi:hypothetical protein
VTRRSIVRVAALALALLAAQGGARAQEVDEYADIVPDSTFEAQAREPVSYNSLYQRDQARAVWSQGIGYNRAFPRFAIGLNANTSTSEDLLGIASKSTTGDIAGKVDWKALHRVVFSLDGNYSMSSISDGSRASTSEQRRNRLALKGQYSPPPVAGARLTLLGTSEYQVNQDLRLSERTVAGRRDSLNPFLPDTLATQRDSSYYSGRLDAMLGRLDWSPTGTLVFQGTAFGSRVRPTTDVVTTKYRAPQDGAPAQGEDSNRSVRLPSDNASLSGALTYTGVRGTKFILQSKRSGIDQVYFDLGQLQVEQFSNDTRNHSFLIESGFVPRLTFTLNAGLNRSLREYQIRSNLNALITAREITTGIAYNDPKTSAFASAIVNRTRAEQQATLNGLTLSRSLNVNVTRKISSRLALVGLGSASLYSYEYDFDRAANQNRSFSVDDRDIASAFGSLGLRFSVTPRCSTAVSFTANRSHDVSLDESRSSGNIATTVYQLNGSVWLPLERNLTISQNYAITATYRIFDYAETRNDLTRNFRINTTIADTLLPFAYLRLDHRYYFFDRGDFSPLDPVGDPRGVRLYGVQQEQFQQTLEGTVGIRPAGGILLIAKQSLADTRNHDLVNDGRNRIQQWNLSLGLEVSRSFWDGAGLIGAVRHEGRYQNVQNNDASINREDNWIAGVTFQKDF